MLLGLAKSRDNRKHMGLLAGLAIAGSIGLIYYLRFKRRISRKMREEEEREAAKAAQTIDAAVGELDDRDAPTGAPKRKHKGGKKSVFDSKFFGRLKLLISIVVPSYKSIEFLQLIALAIIVISRTLISNWLSSLSGDVSRAFFEIDFRSFVNNVLASSALSFASALLAPTLKYLIDKLSLEWRISLTKYIHSKYLKKLMYYKTSNLSNAVPNPDQVVTQDVQKFCEGMCNLYSNLLKPIADLLLYTTKLVQIAGAGGPTAILGYMVFTFGVISALRPPFSSMTSKLQNLEGNFRYCHIRTATNGESIAFYGGDELERNVADRSFMQLYEHKRGLNLSHLLFGFFNDFFVFNLPGSISWIICALPVFFGDLKHASQGELAAKLRYLAAVISHEFTAIGEIVHLNTRLTEIAGYTENIYKLLDTIDEIDNKEKARLRQRNTTQQTAWAASPADVIRFEGVTLTTPKNTVLAHDVTFDVQPGKNMLVTGPNGAGKSSLFRVLAGLWPVDTGVVYMPGSSASYATTTPTSPSDLKNVCSTIYYVPQKPYNTLGSLRENIIYPLKLEQVFATDDELMSLLRRVKIDYLVEREGGFDVKKNWDDILSLGEQQRLAMARLFFHRPKFAILDECTSAVSVDIEKRLYEQCAELGITCITISLRPALKAFHEYELAFDGEGGYKIIHLHQNSNPASPSLAAMPAPVSPGLD